MSKHTSDMDPRSMGPTTPGNARLYAAAPDLLAWLKELVHEIDIAERPAPVESYTLTQARIAIAKAEGRET